MATPGPRAAEHHQKRRPLSADLLQNCDLLPPAKLFGPLPTLQRLESAAGADNHHKGDGGGGGNDSLLRALRLSQSRAREAEEKLAAAGASNGGLAALLLRVGGAIRAPTVGAAAEQSNARLQYSVKRGRAVLAAAACPPAPGRSAARGAPPRSCMRPTWSSASPSTHTCRQTTLAMTDPACWYQNYQTTLPLSPFQPGPSQPRRVPPGQPRRPPRPHSPPVPADARPPRHGPGGEGAARLLRGHAGAVAPRQGERGAHGAHRPEDVRRPGRRRRRARSRRGAEACRC